MFFSVTAFPILWVGFICKAVQQWPGSRLLDELVFWVAYLIYWFR